MKDFKERTIRGGAAKILSQGVTFTLRLGSMMILGRLLEPRDFGLVAMVTAFTGVLSLFKDFGLSAATVQRTKVTDQDASTLFWINLLIGAILATTAVFAAPLLSVFYHEPRLRAVTMVLAVGFFINSAGIQHTATLERELRFTTLAVIDVISLGTSVLVGVSMAWAGFGYWALVAMTLTTPVITTCSSWIATSWIPGPPSRGGDVFSLMKFGGTVTLNSLVVYLAYNLEKVLLGRFWGADSVGMYGRAYQLINIPTDNLNSAVGGVAFAALARLQGDPQRFRSYFLKGYSLVLSLTIPITLMCSLFADDLIFVLLGPKWTNAVPIFRLLTPTILIFAMINPMYWLMVAAGQAAKSLRIALVLSPLVTLGYVLGLPHGPVGVAFGYSAVMTLWVVPHLLWCVRGSMVSFSDILSALRSPMVSAFVAGTVASICRYFLAAHVTSLLRLSICSVILVLIYGAMLSEVMGQRKLYLDLFQRLRGSSTEDEALVSA